MNNEFTEAINKCTLKEEYFVFVNLRDYEIIRQSGYDMTYIKGIKRFSNMHNFARCLNMVKRLKRIK